MKLIKILILSIIPNIAYSSEIISNKYITDSVIKSLVNEIDTRKDSKKEIIKNRMQDYSISYEFRSKLTNNINDFQIPLIWYHERF